MLAQRANSQLDKQQEKDDDQVDQKEGSPAGQATGSAAATPEAKAGSSGATSDEWEKTSLTDIVDQAAKKLADKLNTLPDTRSDEELNEWEFE